MKFVLKAAIAALAVWIVTKLPLDVAVTGGANGDWWSRPLVFLAIGALLVLLNAIIKPIINVVALPVLILTLGLFSAVIAWFMLWLASWITTHISSIHFTIGGFWKTLLAAIVIAVITGILDPVTKDRRRTRR
jgi:putative membrane protein